MKTYKYDLWGTRYGGEHTIGTISKDVATYWIKEGTDVFSEYMWTWDHDEKNADGSIPEEFQLPEWWEVDDIEHLSTVEFESSNHLIVNDASTGEVVAEIAMTEDLIGSIHDPIAQTVLKPDQAIVYGQSFEKGGFNFESLEVTEPFDPSKMKFELTVWDSIKLVHAVTYGDQTLSSSDGDTVGKSYACWIDHWDLMMRNVT
jgi:hypothetical protein